MPHGQAHSANIQDRDGGGLVIATLFGFYPFLTKLFADGGYQGHFRQHIAKLMPAISIDIANVPASAKSG